MNIGKLASILFWYFQSLHVRCTFISAADVHLRQRINDSCLGSKQLSSSSALGFNSPHFARARIVNFISLNKYFLVVAVFGRKKDFQERKKNLLDKHAPIAILLTVAKSYLICTQASQRRTIISYATYKAIVKDILLENCCNRFPPYSTFTWNAIVVRLLWHL